MLESILSDLLALCLCSKSWDLVSSSLRKVTFKAAQPFKIALLDDFSLVINFISSMSFSSSGVGLRVSAI